MLPAPKMEPTVPRRVLVWTCAAVLILCAALVAAFVGLNKAQRWAAGQKRAVLSANNPAAATTPGSPADEAFTQNEFSCSPVTLDKAPDSSLVYARGTIENRAARQRFGVKVELDLLDSTGTKVGNAKDYQGLMEPGGRWAFRALVVKPNNVVSAKVTAITEQH